MTDVPVEDGLYVRTMGADDRAEVAELIYLSTNAWYQASGKPAIFTGDPTACQIFCDTYESLDPGCCLVVENTRTGRIVGSCFFHPRSTHISLGIVNVHPNYFGRGVARRMLEAVIARGEAENLPLRLVSSAMNLDSYSLYTRAGFVPRMAFQDMYLSVPKQGLPPLAESERIRPARLEDAPEMAALERSISGIEREKDYRYFLENRGGIWNVSILTDTSNQLEGFLVSVMHPASNMLGPGVVRTESGAAALIRAALEQHRGRQPVFLVPVSATDLVQRLYSWGAKNCELHFAQIRGVWKEPEGVVMPTFLPETG